MEVYWGIIFFWITNIGLYIVITINEYAFTIRNINKNGTYVIQHKLTRLALNLSQIGLWP